MLAQAVPDIIILDIMLPDGSGLDFLQELKRGALENVPVLLLTAVKTNKDQAKGLRAGGDDYLAKPYDYDIFLARIESLLRRVRRDTTQHGSLTVNHVTRRAHYEGTDLGLNRMGDAAKRQRKRTARANIQPAKKTRTRRLHHNRKTQTRLRTGARVVQYWKRYWCMLYWA
jgi:response regulator RpfG family c-di-GMP phosphodiesterase